MKTKQDKPRSNHADKVTSIWLGPTLKKLSDELKVEGGNKGRGGQFSSRLSDIVERYNTLLLCGTVPVLDDNEKSILLAAVQGGTVSAVVIKHLPELITDTNLPDCNDLAVIASDWDYITRLNAIELVR